MTEGGWPPGGRADRLTSPGRAFDSRPGRSVISQGMRMARRRARFLRHGGFSLGPAWGLGAWAAASASGVAEAEPLADDLAGEVQDCRVVEQDEFGVGGQENRVQLECEPVRVLLGGKLVLFQRGGGEGP